MDLVFRWVHVIAGIMWVGNSMLFNWLDRNLIKPEGAAKDALVGRIWMVHSGGFYDVEKKTLAPHEMPPVLHWFKWQSYTTWMSGVALLVVVYYMGGGALLMDSNVRELELGPAIGIGLGSMVGAFLVYDVMWRTLGQRFEKVATLLTLALIFGVIYGLTHLLSGRAAFIHVGAVVGTMMAGNVFFHIIPSQRELVAATKEGRPQDERIAKRAKQRSIHNNYFTFPLIFIMVSHHFPTTYGSELNWLVLCVLMIAGAGVRHFMNIRFSPAWRARWIPAVAGTIAAGLAGLFFLLSRDKPAAATVAPSGPPVSFTTVHIIMKQRCVTCHSTTPTDRSVVTPIQFDTPEQIKRYSERIKARAVISKTMPLSNKTNMTQEERDILGRWYLEGANITD